MAYEQFTASNGYTIWNYGYIVQIWNRLSSEGIPDTGIAALMGNLYHESLCVPYMVQGGFTYPFSDAIAYTNNVDNGTISEYNFVNKGPNGGGYGLAQWTIKPRKQPYYTKYTTGYSSIGSLQLGLDYLMDELNGTRANGALDYSNVLSNLKSSNTMRQKTIYVLFNFENPNNKSNAVQQIRYKTAQAIYEYMTQTVPPTDPPDDGSGTGGGGGGGNAKPSPLVQKTSSIITKLKPHRFDKRRNIWLS